MSGITNFNCNRKAHSDRRSFELDQELAFLRGDERLIIHDSTKTLSKGAFLVRDNRIFTGPLHWVARYVCSLAPLTPLACFAVLRSLCSLASLARSVHGLAHSLPSLPRGTEIHVFTL